MLRSLVGSEMCIRDRYQRRVRGEPTEGMAIDGVPRVPERARSAAGCTSTWPWFQHPLPAGPARSLGQCAQMVHATLAELSPDMQQDRGDGTYPVSYTHLTLPTKRIV
eukprot:TRINITY_DN9650_c0_g1_i2.p2 TRINITY_DN9650_c0_g1~~TRINITY_DN9650_c0_g1_i2.p2  ORF type:complete len:108 (+),score=22.94 TRINITY_DN9650_c0_g1_i2:113-436(+)